MHTFFTRFFGTTLLAVAMLTSCSRPVAYFQRETVDHAHAFNGQTAPGSDQRFAEASQVAAQAPAMADSSVAYARQDSRIITPMSPEERTARIRKVLVATTGTQRLTETNAPHKLTGVERLLVRRINKHIGRHLAPGHPEKALIRTGKLIGSVVLLIAGLLMLVLGTGTLAFIGLFVGLIGAAGVIVSLIGIDA